MRNEAVSRLRGAQERGDWEREEWERMRIPSSWLCHGSIVGFLDLWIVQSIQRHVRPAPIDLSSLAFCS